MTTMYLSPNAVQQFFDNNGVPLAGGKLFTYVAGTSSTKQDAYTDSTGATPLPNPIILNARGEVAASAIGTSCGLWIDPILAYKFVLAPATDTDPPTNPIWTVDNVVSAQSAVLAALASYEAQLGGTPIGAQIAYAGSTAPPGWLLCYGQAVSRTTYAALYAVTGNTYGSGDGSTTFNLPDKRGRASIGQDNMGGSAANRVTSAGSGINATVQGTGGGNEETQTHTHGVTDPGHNHPLTDTGHTHLIVTGADFGFGGYNTQINAVGANAGGTGQGITETATTGITIANAFTGITVGSYGSGSSQNMPPVQVDTWIIFTGVLS